jgi:uncharacterized membrane protein YbhN (UPF0104 family)
MNALTSRGGRWGIFVIQIAIAGAMLAVLWHFTDGRAAMERLRSAEAEWLVASFLILNAQTILSAARWRLVARALSVPVGRGEAIREYYVSQFVNQVLPGGVAGDVSRAVRSRHGASFKRAAQAVVIERMVGQMALFAVLIIGLPASLLSPGGINWPLGGLVGGIATAIAFVAVIALGWLLLRRYGPFARFGDAATRSLAARDVLFRQIALAVGIVGCNLAAFMFAIRATGTILPVEAAVTIVPLILFSMVVPLTVAGWGFREGAAVALFPLAGASGDAALAGSVAFGLLILASSLPGSLFLVRSRRRSQA